MGGKRKSGKRGAAEEKREELSSPAMCGGPSRVFLLRHGQSESQASGEDVPDAPLTAKGLGQAASWKGQIGRFGAETILVSPLRRAVQTACLAFEGEDVPLELCRFARENWWHERSNQPGPQGQLESLLQQLPRGDEVSGVDECFEVGPDEPRSESENIARLRQVIASRAETTLAIVCHWGVIMELSEASTANAELIECRRYPASGHMSVVKSYPPPNLDVSK